MTWKQTESLYSDIGNEINHLTALQTSDSFNRLTKNAFNNEIRIDSLFKDELNRLTSLKSTVFNLREKIGSLAAAAEFHQKVLEIDHSRAQVAQERICTFAASDLLKLYTSAMTDLNSAQSLSDGFLIIRAEKKIRDIRDGVSQAEKSCPSVNISTIKTYLASINTAQWDQRIHGIFEQSCSKVKSMNADAGAICRQKTINDNSLFYIHTLLNRNSGGVQ